MLSHIYARNRTVVTALFKVKYNLNHAFHPKMLYFAPRRFDML